MFQTIHRHIARDGVAVVEGFLSPAEGQALRRDANWSFELGEYHKAGIGTPDARRIEATLRGDFIYWIHDDDPLRQKHSVFTRIEQLKNFLAEVVFPEIRDVEMHLAIYPPGSGYVRHSDQFRNDRSRIISFACYLNSGWCESDGGRLRLFRACSNGGERVRQLLPRSGRLVCFRSEIEHEVETARRNRYSITGWFLNRPKEG
jgi:SM-20-related protein